MPFRPARPFAAVLLLMLATLAAQAQLLPATPAEGFELPADAAHRAATLEAEVADIGERLERALRVAAEASLDEMQLLGEEHPERLRERYVTELAVFSAPRDPAAWEALYEELADHGRHDAALGAAWHLYTLAATPEERARTLLRLADGYADLGQREVARNVAALAVQAAPSAAVREAFAALEARLRLQITDINIEAEQTLPRACLRLSRPLAANQPIPLADLVSVSPAADVLISAQGKQLCIAGLEHGARYHVTLHAGLLAGDGESLQQGFSRDIEVPHRAPSVAFAPGAYVLPRAADSLLPVRTVNLDEVPLELYRVDDRNLVNTTLEDLVRQPLSRWTRSRIGDTLGTLAWTGTLEVDSRPDREVVTNLPLEQIISEGGAGVYALTAPLPDDYGNAATQWLVISDLGLTTFAADDGLHVFVRSLDDTIPRANIELSLVATNNRVLAGTRTDSDGYARFASGLLAGTGGDAPALLTARAGPDYNFLMLNGPALDLAERGVDGRTPPGPADAFLYTERGIYRPGETVQLSVLLRDKQARAMPDLPLTLRVTRPGGLLALEKVLTTDETGAAHLEIPLANTGNTGLWTASARLDPQAEAVGSVSFQVEDFVPPRVAVEASVAQPRLSPGASETVLVEAQFYYGAPAAGLRVDGRVRIEADPTPFPRYPRFSFGREDLEFSALALPLADSRTAADGSARLGLALPAIADRSQPLRARITAAVHDVGGRPVYETMTAPLDLHPRYVGLRGTIAGSVADGEPAGFEFVALQPDGEPVPGARLRWQFVREHYDYTWFSSGGRWQWRANIIDEPVASDAGTAGDDGRLALVQRLQPGRYRLDLHDADGTASASRRFNVGWWRGAQAANVPDALEVTLAPGEGTRRTAFIDAPFTGRALVTLGNAELKRHFEVDLPEEGRELSFDVEPEWSPGLYLMVTAFRPGTAAASPLPSRAMGLAWVPVGVRARTLDVTLQPPQEARPRGPVEIPLRVTGAAGEHVALTLAAVDEGVLSLTDYATPDPAGHYLGQRALAADLRDIYGDLIATLDAPLGTLRSGGGAAADNLAGPAVRSSRVVALYRRDIMVDADGRTTVRLDLPDFNGRLRLMAVAWNAGRLGSGEAELLVRDPVVADLVLPRFMAAGDRAEARLDLRNPGTQPLTLEVSASSNEPVSASLPARTLTLAAGEGRVLSFSLTAGTVGVAALQVRLQLADGRDILRDYALAVRPATPNVTRREVQALAPGDSLHLPAQPAAGFHGGAHVTVVATNGIAVDLPGMLAELVSYPYGCTEQTISGALPQLVLTDGAAVFNTVTAAIARVLDRQRHDGRFGAWSAGGHAPEWLTPYAYEFLTRAAEQGHDVPAAALRLSERALSQMLDGAASDYAAAYAAYALARTGRATPALVRRFALTRGEELPSRLAHAHIAAALALIGDHTQAERSFERALRQSRAVSLADYGSDLRDAAAMLALMAEHGDMAAHGAALSETLERTLQAGTWFSTQEQAWLLMAADRARAVAGALVIEVDGDAREAGDGTLTLVDGDAPATQPTQVTNTGSTAMRLVSRVRGAPLSPPAPYSDGYRIQRRYYDTDNGEPVEPEQVARGTLLMAVIEGESMRRADNQQLLVVDLLPAGFEIENAALGGAVAELPVLLGPLSETEFANARDDRYVAALRLDGQRRFRLAYLVRAVTAGDFALPGVQVEDMYAPRFRANGPASRVLVSEGG